MDHKLLKFLSFAIVILFCLIPERSASSHALQLEGIVPVPTSQDRELLESGSRLTHEISQQISTVEWLGPLAPIALSPFFGMACLSGIATYGPEWLQQRSGIFGESSPMHNPILFWTMVVLTIISSLPRISKVSKPVAMAIDKLEAYSVVVIVILMRMFATNDSGDQESASLVVTPYLTAGVFSIPIDLALAIASAINILVINGVKLFCELAIWLTPIPLVDAAVEVFNKGLCVGLMSLYCWSPLVATIINLCLLAICATVYFWTQRRIVYYLDLMAGPFLKSWVPWCFSSNSDGETVFLSERWNGIPSSRDCVLRGLPKADGLLLIEHGSGARVTHCPQANHD